MYGRCVGTAFLVLLGCGGTEPETPNDAGTTLNDVASSDDTGSVFNDVVAPDLEPAPSDLTSVQDGIAPFDTSGGLDVPVQGTSFAGTWAQIQRSATVTDSPLGGGTFDTLVHSLHLVVITEESDGTLMAHHSMCAIQSESDFAQTEIIIPAAYINSLEPYSREVTVNWSTKEFTGELVTEVKGCTLANPEDDDLPTSDSDLRVNDQDGDGHPGMTIQVSGLINGDLYVVERNWTQLEGILINEDRVEGLLSWDVEQNKLGSSTPLLSMDIATWVDPDPNKSTFEMVRVDDGDDCVALKAAFSPLF
jgi:hypothetical protein